MNWNPEGWFGHKSENKLQLAEPPISVSSSENIIEKNERIRVDSERKFFRGKLSNLYDALDRSGELDLVGLKKRFREWNKANYASLDADDDIFLGVIDDYLNICGVFEGMKVVAEKDRDKIESKMSDSIDLQRTIVKVALSCFEPGPCKQMKVADQKRYGRLIETVDFLDKLSGEMMLHHNLISRDSMVRQYISGLRSMMCAALLAESVGFNVEFPDETYDIKFDLDMVFVTPDGRRMAVDVTTKQNSEINNPAGIQWFRDNNVSRVPNDVKKQLNLTHCSRLIISRVSDSGSGIFDREGKTLGLPSETMIASFRNMLKIKTNSVYPEPGSWLEKKLKHLQTLPPIDGETLNMEAFLQVRKNHKTVMSQTDATRLIDYLNENQDIKTLNAIGLFTEDSLLNNDELLQLLKKRGIKFTNFFGDASILDEEGIKYTYQTKEQFFG